MPEYQDGRGRQRPAVGNLKGRNVEPIPGQELNGTVTGGPVQGRKKKGVTAGAVPGSHLKEEIRRMPVS